MNTEEFKNITPYKDINNLLFDWVENARSILGENVVGLYLSGSLTYGDFVSERSDIDLEAIVKRPLSEKELELIEQLHKNLDERYPAWKNRTECSYVPLDLMKEISPPKASRPWWGFDKLIKTALPGNEWIINHYSLSRYGVALYGPDFNTLIPPIDKREVQKANAKDLFEEWEPKINDTEWLGNVHYQSYLILNLCRILYTALGGEPGSKKIAAQWVKVTYPQWIDLIEEAERWKYGIEMTRSDDAIAFIKFAVEKVRETEIASSPEMTAQKHL